MFETLNKRINLTNYTLSGDMDRTTPQRTL